MNPTPAQYFFARGRPFQLVFVSLFIGAPLFFTYGMGHFLARTYAPLSDASNLLRVVFLLAVSLLLSFFVALVAGGFLASIFWPLLRPLYNARCAKNGAPFHVGDRVQILIGRHKGRVVRVYGGWRDGSLRVDLGKTEKDNFKDIFDPIQLLRADAEASVAPGTGGETGS